MFCFRRDKKSENERHLWNDEMITPLFTEVKPVEAKVTISEEEWKSLEEGGKEVSAALWEKLGQYILQGLFLSFSRTHTKPL